MRITMIGHSTVLIETSGKKILTDPFWGMVGNPAYARLSTPAMTRQELSDVDGVLISHDHWDHWDGKYLCMLGDLPVIVPRLTRWLIKLIGGRNVIGITAWEKFNIGEVTITAVPAIHLTVTVGYILQSENRQIYFSGDTFYHAFMQEIGCKFELDVALIPVTTFRIPMTKGEKGAVQTVQALKPAVVIPVHLGIKPRSPLLCTNQTLEGFTCRLNTSGITTKVINLREGESYTV